jgi:hypothetical protein
MKGIQKFGHAFAIGVLCAAVMTATPAHAQDVTVVVNGQQVGFDQPPIERSGRVFVPLRGVFERLGATVVYDNGVINATGSGHTISLHIGSTVAIVDNNQQTLDVAPFLVGARTLVPLRFISQALGAYVDYNGNSQTVTITSSGAPGATPTPSNSVSITNMRPPANGTVKARRPAISGSFSRAVDPNSVRITLDGRDVSSTTYVSSTNFLFSPSYDLQPGTHVVRVTGTDADGSAFDRTWSFSSGNSSAQNSITGLSPAEGATVGGTFTVSGTTAPNSRVHITAIGTTNMGGYFTVSTGSYDADVSADSSGNFSQQVTLNTVSGGDIGVRLTSVAPVTNASSTVTMHYHG